MIDGGVCFHFDFQGWIQTFRQYSSTGGGEGFNFVVGLLPV
jgi:hypothetical protein